MVWPFKLKTGLVSLPECFAKLGFDGKFMPTKKNVDFRYNELAKVLDPENAFGDQEKFDELKLTKKLCYDYIESKEKND